MRDKVERFLSSLTRKQKENVILLQIGTFLEYFDLMLYVHMVVILNDIFFPPVSHYAFTFLTALAFCSSYIARPFGALIFGYIGDRFGRKSTVVMTMFMMSLSCIFMASLPAYAQIGITATWLMILCRVMQGISSLGEIIGAEIYITESLSPPIQYPAVAFITVAAALGGTTVLALITFIINAGLNWRLVFCVGAFLSFVGFIARRKLRETPEYLRHLQQKAKTLEQLENDGKKKITKFFNHLRFNKDPNSEKVKYKTLFFSFALYCAWPLTFYISFIYFSPFLKDTCGYSSQDIVFHNFLLSFVVLFSEAFVGVLSYKIHPLTILRVKGLLFLCYVIVLPFLLLNATSHIHIFIIQSIFLLISLSETPAQPLIISAFPVFKRFTIVSLLYSISRAVMYVIVSFGLILLTEKFGYWGLYFITLPTALFFLWGVKEFTARKVNIKSMEEKYRSLVQASL